MGEGYQFVVTGARELRRHLRLLATAAANRVARRAVNMALTPVAKAAKRKAPVETGLLKKSIGKKVKVYRRSEMVWGGVGPRKGFKGTGPDGKPRNPLMYAHLVELGTKAARKHAPTAAKPFLRPALDEQRATVMAILRQEIMAGIDKELMR